MEDVQGGLLVESWSQPLARRQANVQRDGTSSRSKRLSIVVA